MRIGFRHTDAAPRALLAGVLSPLLGLLLGLAPVAAAETSPTLERIAATQRIAIGYRENEPPFSYLIDGEPSGYSTEICRYVAESLRKRLKLDRLDIDYVKATTATRFVLVRSGRIDLECTATTNNAERRGLVEFSYPHFVAATRFVALKKSGVGGISDLSGRTVTSVTGTVNIEQLNEVNRRVGLNVAVMISRNNVEAFARVETGQAAAFVMDDILLAGLVAASREPAAFVISSEAFGGPEPYGFLMPLGDTGFKTAVNEILGEFYRSREMRALYRRWFQSPIPPAGTNLRLPISPELEAYLDEPREYLE